MKHLLQAQKLYILSGLPAAGKSTLLENIPADMVLSADKIREQMFGVKTEIKNGVQKEYLYGWDKQPELFFSIVNSMLEERMREQLTTFLDTTSLHDEDRGQAIEIAKKFNMDAEVLILDVPLETVLERNRARTRSVTESAYIEMNELFKRDSIYPYRTLNAGDTIELAVNKLSNDKLDVVGDVHGLYDELVELLHTAGYVLDSRGIPSHPDGRKLLFLGDVVDRGRKSVEMLKFIELAVNQGGHFFVPGNHEDKLVKIWDLLQKQQILQTRSRSGAETLNDLLKLNEDEQSKLINFLKFQKVYKLVDSHGISFAMAHADTSTFDPIKSLKSSLLYGDSGHGARDSDLDYQLGVEAGINKYHYIRGHIPQTSLQPNVRSLEFEQAFNGYLTLLRLDNYAKDLSLHVSEEEAFHKNVLMHKCDYNYNPIMKSQFAMVDELSKLQEVKLVNAAIEPKTGLALYKYDRKVFFDGLWGEHPLLLKARGLVLDIAGNIVQHPFDKIFNYGERDTALDLPDNTVVEAVEKLNGFLGCITKHPYRNELLVTTTGSFNSEYVGYINSLITPAIKGKLMHHLSRNNETLMFEVIHPEDNEHPVQYKEADQGLWLIGAREKNMDSRLKSENYLDDLGLSLGLKRPARYETTLGEVRKWAKTSELEGFIVRLKDGDGEPITKLKTVHYLTTKFLGRLSVNNIKFMYNSPAQFKLRLDEEYQELVDIVVNAVPRDEFMAYTNSQKINMMRDIIQKMRSEGEQKAQTASYESMGL